MDRAKLELNAVEQTVLDATEDSVLALDDLQLAMVGGGIADPILA